MLRTKALFSLFVVIVVVMMTAIPSYAQDAVSRHYTVTPKEGMVQQFEAALKSHVQWRAENNDPWTWGVSTVEVGENLGDYGISSFGHSWADFDEYDAGFGPKGLVHWNATVAPLVASISSAISTTNPSISKLPPAGTQLAFVTVTTFHVRPGREAQFNQAITSATKILMEADFGGYWVWASDVVGGGPGPRMNLVSLYGSWAEMAEPDPTFPAILMQALGEDGFREWGEELGQTYRGIESSTLRIRPDLGVNQN